MDSIFQDYDERGSFILAQFLGLCFFGFVGFSCVPNMEHAVMTPADSTRFLRNWLVRKLLCLRLSETEQGKSLSVKRNVWSNGKITSKYYLTNPRHEFMCIYPLLLKKNLTASSWPPQRDQSREEKQRPRPRWSTPENIRTVPLDHIGEAPWYSWEIAMDQHFPRGLEDISYSPFLQESW